MHDPSFFRFVFPLSIVLPLLSKPLLIYFASRTSFFSSLVNVTLFPSFYLFILDVLLTLECGYHIVDI